MDIFDTKDISPMLIKDEVDPFDDPNYVFELKLDGIRGLAYLDPKSSTAELRNKRGMKLNSIFPELSDINKQVKRKCILDGEFWVLKDGRPNFREMQRRSIMSDRTKIMLASKHYPASFTAYDILYYDNNETMDLPLMERKAALQKALKSENNRLSISRYIEEKGIEYYNLVKEQKLEGIVAKQKNSLYYPGKKTKDWLKIKYMIDKDFVICGYIYKENHMVSLVLGQYDKSKLVFQGHVTFGVAGKKFEIIKAIPKTEASPFPTPPPGHDRAIWIMPVLVCTVQYMPREGSDAMYQPVLKAIRDDKLPQECTI